MEVVEDVLSPHRPMDYSSGLRLSLRLLPTLRSPRSGTFQERLLVLFLVFFVAALIELRAMKICRKLIGKGRLLSLFLVSHVKSLLEFLFHLGYRDLMLVLFLFQVLAQLLEHFKTLALVFFDALCGLNDILANL